MASKLSVISGTIKWTIENYSKIGLKEGQCILSPEFVIDEGKQKWILEFYPNGAYQFPDCVVCLARRIEGCVDNIVTFTYQLLSLDEKLFISSKTKSVIFHKNDNQCWSHAVTSSKSLQNEMKTWNADVLIIRCIMDIEKASADSSFDLEAKTSICLNHATFAWCVREPDSSKWSEQKSFNCSEKVSLEVILTTVEDDILIEIKNISKINLTNQCMTGKITVIDVTNVERLSVKDTYDFGATGENKPWKFPNFITKTELKERNCIGNGFFTVILDFSVPNGITTKKLNDNLEYGINLQIISKQSVDAITALQCDLKEMLLGKKHSDVRFKAEEQLFSAHKCLLSSRSPVFRAMFDSEMLESQTNVVDINDLDSSTLESLLKFLYTGIIDEENCANVLKLMLAADKYQVQSLVEKCAETLMNILCLENVFDIIVIADSLKHSDLKASALKLIVEQANEILLSESWSEWSKQNIHLAFEITSLLALQAIK